MSTFLQSTKYHGRALENQLTNTLINAHDLCCGCPEPLKHIHHLTTKCLTSGDPTAIALKEEDILETGDLEKLFEEDVFDEEG